MENKKYKADIKLTLGNLDERVFGPGVYDLLSLIKKTGSTKDAARQMGLSYSKALKILKNAEMGLGINIIEKQRGGKAGGLTEITLDGIKLMESYASLYKTIKKNLDKEFETHFDRFLNRE